MSRMIRRVASLRLNRGFTLIEVMVAGLVLVVGFIFIAQFFTSAAQRVLTSDTRSLMEQVATQEIETIRALQYQDVGTVGGNPAGALLNVSDPMVVEGRSFRIVREVTYIKDSSYSGPYPANYRRATVKVYLKDGTGVSPSVDPVVMSTNVGGGAQGGTLDITVSDLSGAGVQGAQLTITDNVLVPNVLINAEAIHTDNDGKMMVPGLTADPAGGYLVVASLPGYNSAALKQTVVVLNGTPFTVVQLIIDRLATMIVHVVDQDGVALPGVAFTVTGYQSVSPWTFSQTVTSDASGIAMLSNIRYSTSLEPYFIQLVTPHNPALRLPTGVDPPTIDSSFLPLPDGKIPVLLNPGQTQDVYVVVSSVPVVTALNPTGGPMIGGTTVIITGTNLTGASVVKFGNTNATSFTVNSATQITAVSPAGTGTVDVTVTTPKGTSATSSADQYTYIPAPAVSAVSPTSGPKTGGATVTITGTSFTGASVVRFGGTNATSFTVNSDTQITAVTPAGNGMVDVTVTTPGGTSAISSADHYTFVSPPTVTNVNPTSGSKYGGATVTITGTNFTGATVVKFGNNNATSFTVVSATQITAVSPAGTKNTTVDVTVTTPGGTSAITNADHYSYGNY